MARIKCEVTTCKYNESTIEDAYGYCLKDEINLIFVDDDYLDCKGFQIKS